MAGDQDNNQAQAAELLQTLKYSMRANKGHKTRFLVDLEALEAAMLEAPCRRTMTLLTAQYDKWSKKCSDIENQLIDLANLDKSKSYMDELNGIRDEMAEWLKRSSVALALYDQDPRLHAPAEATKGIKVRTDLKPEKLSAEATPVEFRNWKEDFEVYFESSKLSRGSPREQQRSLLTCLDDELADMIKQNVERDRPVFPRDLRDLQGRMPEGIDSCMDLLEGHFESHHPLALRRIEFMRMNQGASQSLSQFATALRGAWLECSFEQMTAYDMLRTILTHGCRNQKMRDRLRDLDPKSTWKDIKDNIKYWEANTVEDKTENARFVKNQNKQQSRPQQQQQQSSSQANRRPTNRQRRTKATIEAEGKCWRCGQKDHKAPECKLSADIICNKCGKQGHKSSVCLSSARTGQGRQQARQVDEATLSDQASEESCNAVGAAEEVLFS
jgi:hypothetical protein